MEHENQKAHTRWEKRKIEFELYVFWREENNDEKLQKKILNSHVHVHVIELASRFFFNLKDIIIIAKGKCLIKSSLITKRDFFLILAQLSILLKYVGVCELKLKLKQQQKKWETKAKRWRRWREEWHGRRERKISFFHPWHLFDFDRLIEILDNSEKFFSLIFSFSSFLMFFNAFWVL